MIGGLALATQPFGGGTGGSSQQVPLVEQPTPIPEETPSNVVQYEKPEPEQVLEPGKQYAAVLKTDKGEIRIELFADKAPRAVASFVSLAEQGFYDDLLFFFVTQGFVVQAGDPTCDATGKGACTGSGGPGYTLAVEVNDLSHIQGAVVLPATIEGEEVHGSQFRILLADDPRLDGRETVFGRVVAGLDILESLQDIVPCFGLDPSDTNPCDISPPPGPAIQGVVIEGT